METLKIYNNTHHSTKNLIKSAVIAGILGLSTVSCWETTSKDINNQKHKIELLSFNIKQCINARKKIVNDYNTLVKYPKTEANQYEIDNHLSLMEKQIEEYDEKIKDFAEEKLDAENSLNEKIQDRWIAWIHTAIDPNKWDYLLSVQ